MVQAQLLRADLIDLCSQPHRLRSGQKTIPAGDDQMHIDGQPVCKHTKKQRGASVRQQVEIVNEDVAGCFSRQHMAEVIHQQSAARCVRGAGVFPQKGETCVGKRLLYAFPEDGEVAGVYADADDFQGFRLGALTQIPVHRRGLSVAHGRDHGRHSAAGNRPQALLQPLRYVNGIQVPFRFWHGQHLRTSNNLYKYYIQISESFQA